MTANVLTRESERTWATVAHLSAFLGWFTVLGFWVGPLACWLVFQDRSSFVAEHAKEALNFHLSLLIYAVVAGLLTLVLIGFPLLLAIALVQLIFPIVAAVRANEHGRYRYPLTLRLVS